MVLNVVVCATPWDVSCHLTSIIGITTEDQTAPFVSSAMILDNSDARPVDPEHSLSEPVPGHGASPRDVYVGAPLKPAEKLFHEHFWDSIRRIPNPEQPGAWLADISMVFQQGHIREHFGCQMEIGIAEEKVAGLAFEYFGVKVETKDGVRSVRVNGGGKIEPDPSIKLRACGRDLSGIFRNDLHEGACTSPIYQRENEELRNRTDGVSMTIPAKAKDAGRITVFLGEWRASKIKTEFYG